MTPTKALAPFDPSEQAVEFGATPTSEPHSNGRTDWDAGSRSGRLRLGEQIHGCWRRFHRCPPDLLVAPVVKSRVVV